MYNIFISYASEDKIDIAKPLADLLIKKKIKVWFDDYELNVGDSLRNSIDNGLKKSDFGLVILSPNFFKKQWTEYELNSLVTLERAYSQKKIIPVWHNLEIQDIIQYSPNLADKVAAKTNAGLENVIIDILKAIRKSEPQDFTKSDFDIITVEKPPPYNIETIIELLKDVKQTKYLWLGLCELNETKEIVNEEIKEDTLLRIKDSLDKLLLMGFLSYEVKHAYDMITTKQRVYSIQLSNISTQIKNMVKLIQKKRL